MSNTELDQLIDLLVDGEINEADFLRLEAEFQLRPEARERYYQRLRFETLVESHVAELQETGPKTISGPSLALRWRTIGLGIAAALALATSAIWGWKLGQSKPAPLADSTQRSEEPQASGFAVISESADASWDGTLAPARGDLVSNGELALTGGIVKLDLFSGVTVVIEGAARFELLSTMEMKVSSGKVRASVPQQASGFRILTDRGELVDLGTEFLLDVTNEHADLHVLDGEVEWHTDSNPTRNLRGGEAVRMTEAGKSAPLAIAQSRIAEVEANLVARRELRRQEWLKHIAQRSTDPRLIAFFPMASVGADENATIVRANPANDRWNHAGGALDFSPTGSRVRLDLDGEYGSLTFVCWAKIDSLDRWCNNSLFLTDGHELNEPHWQIMDDGRLFFSVKKREWKNKEEPDKHIFYSPRFWDQSMSGKWTMIATVYDIETKMVRHFLNGKQISKEAIPEEFLVEKVHFGAASIGNWSEPKHRTDPHFAMRNLNGSIDEFAIYSSALDARDIAELYENGKP